jgi:hypothetical protein
MRVLIPQAGKYLLTYISVQYQDLQVDGLPNFLTTNGTKSTRIEKLVPRAFHMAIEPEIFAAVQFRMNRQVSS